MARELSLPISVVTPIDLGRLLREIHLIDETLLQMRLRKAGSEVKMPKTSRLMDQLIETNKLNLLQEPERQILQEFLESVRAEAPVLHMSFSADPSANFMEKLTAWLRSEIHPLVLVTVGLQPNIGAGCILRTTNRQFDLSLREDFAKHRDLLAAKMRPEVAQA